jgi:hypothetical protein
MKKITNKTILKQGDKTFVTIESDGVIYWRDEHLNFVAQLESKIEGVPIVSLNPFNYDELGQLKIKDALLAFKDRHGYELQTEEERDIKFKNTGVGGDYLYYSHYELDYQEDKVLLYYNEHTPHDCPYHVCLELPMKDIHYPRIDISSPVLYTLKDIEKAIELARKEHDTGMGTMSQGYVDMIYTYDKNEIFNQINIIKVIEVDEQFNILSYE